MPVTSPSRSRRRAFCSLALGFRLLTSASAYATPSSTHDVGISLSHVQLPFGALNENGHAVTMRRQSAQYSLGLGRHAAVKGVGSDSSSTSCETLPRDAYEAVQFLVEHDAAMEYPSPQKNQERLKEQIQVTGAKRASSPSCRPTNAAPGSSTVPHKRHLFVRPKRLSPDLFEIRYPPTPASDGITKRLLASTNHPVAVVKCGTRRVGWELNTAWVELLIHEQQQKLDAAPQSA